jgi:hypothetical protein
MSQGVEWAMHVLVSLAWVDDGQPVPTAQLAASYDLPPAYLNKQLQAVDLPAARRPGRPAGSGRAAGGLARLRPGGRDGTRRLDVSEVRADRSRHLDQQGSDLRTQPLRV